MRRNNAPSATLVVPGSLEKRTGGSIYDRRIVDGLRERGWSMEVVELDDSFPFPTKAALEHAERVLGAMPSDAIVIVDSLALGAMPDLLSRAETRLRIVALVHLPLAADRTRDRDTAARLEVAERRALGASRLVVVTGAAALPLLDRFGLRSDRIIVVEPGTDRASLARGSDGGPLTLLSVAALHPGKGHDTLLSALAAVRHIEWRLICAGSLTRHPATVDRVRALMQELNLEDRVSLAGELDEASLADAYDHADLFVSPSLQETYGMAVAEALARGLPVVATLTGAARDLVGDSAGLLVPTGDISALASALSRVLDDADLRARLAEGARRVRERLPDWEQASARMAAALESLGAHG
jgi:glycosyltransferase involved in cell wall biosynthesis